MINKHTILGRVGKDPEIRNTSSGKKVAMFSVATTEKYKDQNGEKKENTDWHNIVAWHPFAEVAEKYIKKGDMIYIEGRSVTRSWDDKSGAKRYITEIVVRDLKLLSHKSKEEIHDHASGSDGDELPF